MSYLQQPKIGKLKKSQLGKGPLQWIIESYDRKKREWTEEGMVKAPNDNVAVALAPSRLELDSSVVLRATPA